MLALCVVAVIGHGWTAHRQALSVQAQSERVKAMTAWLSPQVASYQLSTAKIHLLDYVM